MKIVWLAEAEDDYDWQIEYIRAHDPRAALEHDERIETQVESLVDFPDGGRRGRINGTRELVITGTPFVAIYRIKPRLGRIEILRLLHHAQRWPKRKPIRD